jgi:hypothetical protein
MAAWTIFSYLAAVTINSDRAALLDPCVALLAFSSGDPLGSILAVTQDLGLYSLIPRTDIHVLQ